MSKSLRRFLWGVVGVFALMGSAPAFAQSRPFDIPEEYANQSLPEFARQAGVQIVAPGDQLRDVKTPAVKGNLSIEEALNILINGTGLEVANSSAKTIALRQREKDSEPSIPSRPSDDRNGGGQLTIESVVVTGSRVISDPTRSPTPLTVITKDQLQATSPSDLPTALNKLPIFQGSTGPRATTNASTNSAGNTLNLRAFGANRTLVLMEGHRIAPTNSDGSVNIDTLPQMLINRVDVVTGGASAVYGSDAVTGVVNFVLDKQFNGFEIEANSGISNYADAASYQMGIAAGTTLFRGRGHVEGSARFFNQDGVFNYQRPEGPYNYLLTGAGTAANPFLTTAFSTLSTYANGGKITCANCAANGMQFIQNGVIGPFNPGTPTGTVGISIGGDGAVDTLGQVTSSLRTAEAFARFSYDISDTVSFYLQGTAAESYNKGSFINNLINPGVVPNTFFSDNPYLSPTAQSLLSNGTTNTFQIAEYIIQPGNRSAFQTNGLNSNQSITAGLDGMLMGKYVWNLFYTHGQSRLEIFDPNNQNNQKMYAAQDAVLGPNGTVVCFVSTTPYASLYPGCTPMNPFGPTALSNTQYQYFLQRSQAIFTNVLDDLGGGISGNIFDLPAGPVKAALSAEARWTSYDVVSNAQPTQNVDCTGLRLCNPTVQLWQSNITANRTPVSNDVWEIAGEVNIPLVNDAPLVQSLGADIAGRYTDYSVSGVVQTWKIGLDWHVDDNMRFRATNSIDIRAPTLNDLFSPFQLTPQSFTDLHTGNLNGNVPLAVQGNPSLVPEVARTYTGGVVLTPTFFHGFSFSMDYYRIVLKNAITAVNSSSVAVQQLCESSVGTSPLCDLYMRPLPFSDHSVANYPTLVRNKNLNAAVNRLEGWDIEADYYFDLADVLESIPGSINARFLANIQPVNQQVQFPGTPLTFTATAKGHATAFLSYNFKGWTLNFQDRWVSGYPKAQAFGQIYAVPRVGSINYFDMNVDKNFDVSGSSVDAYLSVQNIANIRPPLNPANSTNPGLFFMSARLPNLSAYDAVGRYFTIGVRAKF